MASKPPGGSGGFTPIPTEVSLSEALRGPLLTPLPQTQPDPVVGACSINGTYGRVQTFLTAGPTPEELRRRAEERQRFSNTLGIALLGPVFGGPAATVRALGGSEDAVEAAGLLGANLIGVGGSRIPAGRRGVSVAAMRRGGNNLRPDPNAQGSHTTFRTDQNGNVTHHAQWDPNPRNPTGFDQTLRVDTQYANPHSHGGIPTPHAHLPGGGTRPALPGELPP